MALLLQRLSAAALTGWLALATAPVLGQYWRVLPTLSVEETATNNVNLSASENRQSDLVTQITPSLHFTEKGARTSLDGVISLPLLLYLRTGSDNNRVSPSANVNGRVELVEDFFFLEGSVSVSQQFLNPFGAQPDNLANATQNRYTSVSYRVSPFIRGVTPSNVRYELRNVNGWANLSNAPIGFDNSHYTQWTGFAAKTDTTLGWQANFDINNIQFNDQNKIYTRLARVGPVYNVDPQLRLRASVGYERNEYTLTESSNVIYGVGLEWRPTPRTHLVGTWEHRFFGSSYLFSFDHRTPLTIWNLRASRNINTYPQQIATLPAGVDVFGLINQLFLSRIADPVQRQAAVEQFIADQGFPSVLSSPVPLYSQRVLLQQSASATVGFLGARNTLLFSVATLSSEPITAAGDPFPPLLAGANDNRQTSATVIWTHRLTPSVNMTSTLQASQTVATSSLEAATRQGVARVVFSSPLSAKTTAFAGARYQVLLSDVSLDYNEVAVFVGLTHAFR